MPPNKIELEQWLIRCEAFYKLHPSEYSSTTGAQVSEMFELHNDKLSPNEKGKWCSKCCGRVYKRLHQYYQKLKINNE